MVLINDVGLICGCSKLLISVLEKKKIVKKVIVWRECEPCVCVVCVKMVEVKLKLKWMLDVLMMMG